MLYFVYSGGDVSFLRVKLWKTWKVVSPTKESQIVFIVCIHQIMMFCGSIFILKFMLYFVQIQETVKNVIYPFRTLRSPSQIVLYKTHDPQTR